MVRVGPKLMAGILRSGMDDTQRHTRDNVMECGDTDESASQGTGRMAGGLRNLGDRHGTVLLEILPEGTELANTETLDFLTPQL